MNLSVSQFSKISNENWTVNFWQGRAPLISNRIVNRIVIFRKDKIRFLLRPMIPVVRGPLKRNLTL